MDSAEERVSVSRQRKEKRGLQRDAKKPSASVTTRLLAC